MYPPGIYPTAIVKQIVEGSFDVPDKMDDATSLIIEKRGRIGVQLTNNNDIMITTTTEKFQYF